MGLTMDIFYDTGGLHAAAAVLLGFLRPWVLRLLTPRDGYDSADSVNVHQMGWQWFGVYLALLVLLHHAAFFLLELGSFRHFGAHAGKNAGERTLYQPGAVDCAAAVFPRATGAELMVS